MEGLRGYSTAIAVGFVLVALSVLGFKWHGLNERASAATPAALYSYAPPKRDVEYKGGQARTNGSAAAPKKSKGVSPSKAPGKPAPVAPKPAPKKAKTVLPALRSINLNTATQAQLEALPGIGPALASRIVSYRNQHGRFGSVDELDAVKGIGPKKLADIAPYCFVD